MKIKKIPSFTLVELIIVMILSLLVTGSILLGVRHFQVYMTKQKKNNSLLSNISLLENALNSNFFLAEKVEFDNNQLLFYRDSIFASCRIHENYLLFHKQFQSDSFPVKVLQTHCVKIKNSNLVSTLYLDIQNNHGKITLSYKKEYGKSVLYNINPENEH